MSEIVVELLNGAGTVVDHAVFPLPHSLRDTTYLPQVRVYYRKEVGIVPMIATAEFGAELPRRQE